ELIEPFLRLEKPFSGAGLTFGVAACTDAAFKLYNDLLSTTADSWKAVFDKGLTGSAANAEVWQAVAATIRGKGNSNESIPACEKLAEVFQRLAVTQLRFLSQKKMHIVAVWCISASGRLGHEFRTSVDQ
ncbi:unnamed protein product, partial [Symbiodinium sp. CCMP2456]